MRRTALLLLLAASAHAAEVPHGRLEVLNETQVVTVEGAPEQMGTAYGTLLAPLIRRVIKAVITDGVGKDPEAYKNILAGSRVMQRFQPQEFRDELRAIAKAAEVSLDDLTLLQYFGDVRRCIGGAGSSTLCTSFACLPPLTRGKICLVGRNFDYFDEGVGEYASIIAHYRPEGRIPFVTLTWAGVINGWTLLNAKGIVTSNDTAFGTKVQSLEGISTCFMLRVVAERASTVAEGVELIRKGPRACGTIILVASGRPPDAAIVEFDAKGFAVRRPEKGFVGAANSLMKLYQEDSTWAGEYWGRAKVARDLAFERAGRLDFSEHNLAGADGVPIEGMNLHSAVVDATNLRFKVAMGRIPACKLPYRTFWLTPDGVVSHGTAEQPPAPEARLLPKGFLASARFIYGGVLPCGIVLAAWFVVRVLHSRRRRVRAPE